MTRAKDSKLFENMSDNEIVEFLRLKEFWTFDECRLYLSLTEDASSKRERKLSEFAEMEKQLSDLKEEIRIYEQKEDESLAKTLKILEDSDRLQNEVDEFLKELDNSKKNNVLNGDPLIHEYLMNYTSEGLDDPQEDSLYDDSEECSSTEYDESEIECKSTKFNLDPPNETFLANCFITSPCVEICSKQSLPKTSQDINGWVDPIMVRTLKVDIRIRIHIHSQVVDKIDDKNKGGYFITFIFLLRFQENLDSSRKLVVDFLLIFACSNQGEEYCTIIFSTHKETRVIFLFEDFISKRKNRFSKGSIGCKYSCSSLAISMENRTRRTRNYARGESSNRNFDLYATMEINHENMPSLVYDVSSQNYFVNDECARRFGSMKEPIMEMLFVKVSDRNYMDFVNDREWGIIHESSFKATPDLVKLFFANMHDMNFEGCTFRTMIGTKTFEVNKQVISELILYPYLNMFLPCSDKRYRVSNNTISSKIRGTWSGNSLLTNGIDFHLKVFGKLACANLCPSNMHKTKWTRDVAELVYHLVNGVKNFDYCGLMIRQMITIRVGKSRTPGFACLITRICSSFGIVWENAREKVPKKLGERILNQMRGKVPFGPPPIRMEGDPQSLRRKIERKKNCIVDLIDRATEIHPDLTLALNAISDSYKNTSSEEEEEEDTDLDISD